MPNNEFLLNQNTAVYEGLFTTFAEPHATNDLDSSLAVINMMSNFAWRMHIGRYADLRLEDWAARIGQRIWASNHTEAPLLPTKAGVSRVLHVISQTCYVGGHTRLMWNVIRGDTQSLHNVVLVHQDLDEVPKWLDEAVIASGGTIITLKGRPLIEQVAVLQQLLTKQADRIFYHIHPNDGVSVAALAAVPRPQVLTINHADHTFWLGSALSDVTVGYRAWSLPFSLNNRHVQRVMLLPTPLNFAPMAADGKQVSRKALGIDDDKIVLLTVASAYKFKPSEEHNYYRVVKRVLDVNPQVLVKIIGVKASEGAGLGFEPHERIELLGPIDDPKSYYQAADIYMDAMPFSSFTSLFEAMYFRCFPVLQYNPGDTLNIEREPAFNGLVSHAHDELAQFRLIQRAIDDAAFREETAARGAALIQENYMGEGWQHYLSELYRASAAPVHSLRDLRPLLNEIPVITQNDLDAVALSRTFHGTAANFALYGITQDAARYSVSDALKLFLTLKNQPQQFGQQLSLRQLLYFLKIKLRTTLGMRPA